MSIEGAFSAFFQRTSWMSYQEFWPAYALFKREQTLDEAVRRVTTPADRIGIERYLDTTDIRGWQKSDRKIVDICREFRRIMEA